MKRKKEAVNGQVVNPVKSEAKFLLTLVETEMFEDFRLADVSRQLDKTKKCLLCWGAD